MAGLLDDPTTNPIAGALTKMGDTLTTPVMSASAAAPDQNNPLPTGATDPLKPLPVPDKVSPLPLPQTGTPAPVPAPIPVPVPPPPAPDNRTVEERLNGIIAANSDYIRRARQEGVNFANKRGLANSSIAAGAEQGAAIDRALPIAQQDTDIAAQDRRLGMSIQAEQDRLAQAAGYDMERLKADAANNLIRDAQQAQSAQDLAHVQGTIQSALQSQGNTEQIQRMGVDLSNQLQLQDRTLQSDLAKITASGDQDIRRLVEAGNQERVTLQQSIAAQDRQAMASAMVNIFQIEQQLRSALLSNDKISAQERAAYEKTITDLGQPIRDFMNKLFGPDASMGTAEISTATGTGLMPGLDTGGLGGGTGTATGVGTTGTAGTGDLVTTSPNDQPVGNPSLPYIPMNGLVPPDQLTQLGLQ